MINFAIYLTVTCGALFSVVVLFRSAKSGVLIYRELSALRQRSGGAITPPIAPPPEVGTRLRNVGKHYGASRLQRARLRSVERTDGISLAA